METVSMSDKRDLLLDHDFDGVKELDNDLPPWWRYLFYVSIIFSAIYLLYFHVLGIGDLSDAEYQREMNPNWQPAKAEASVLEYRSPFYNPQEKLTPRIRLEVQLAELQSARVALANGEGAAGPSLDQLSFDDLIIAAMRKADAGNQEKLKQAFPQLWVSAESGKSLPAASAAPTNEAPAAALTDAASISKGQAIFATNCASCHGKAGEGGIGPNMTDEYWIHGGGMNNIVRTINAGVPAKGMISWKPVLKEKEIMEVASYLLTLEGTNPPNGKKPQGEKWVSPL
jgi:mono/diheme cytochrome c family protein